WSPPSFSAVSGTNSACPLLLPTCSPVFPTSVGGLSGTTALPSLRRSRLVVVPPGRRSQLPLPVDASSGVVGLLDQQVSLATDDLVGGLVVRAAADSWRNVPL